MTLLAIALLAAALAPACAGPSCSDEPAPPAGAGVELGRLDCSEHPGPCAPVCFVVTVDGLDGELVAAALADWTASTAGAVSFALADDDAGDAASRRCSSSSSLTIERDDRIGARGFTDAGVVHVSLAKNCGRRALEHVVRHELGHALGLQHSPSSSALMFATYFDGAPIGVQEEDAQAFFDLYRCCPGGSAP